MRPTSAAFREAIRLSHRMAVTVEVLLTNGSVQEIPIHDGSVTLDITAASRGRVDLQLVDDGTLGLVPTSAASLLAPYGNEMRVRRGLYLPDGTVELVGLGIFRIDSCDVEDTPEGVTIALAGLDRSAGVIDAKFEEAYEVLAGTNAADAIRDAVLPAMPGVVTDFSSTSYVTPALRAAEGDDRWKFVQDIATACGLILYFDGEGILCLRPLTTGAPVATLAEGDGGVLLNAKRGWKREGSTNRVIATGENPGEGDPARGIKTDDNPLSPTRYGGPFGIVPTFYQSQFIVTDDQAADAAQGILARQLGTTQQVDFGVIVDPSLEPLDVVRITRLRAAIDEDHVIDQVTIPLTPEASTSGSTRAVQVS